MKIKNNTALNQSCYNRFLSFLLNLYYKLSSSIYLTIASIPYDT